MRVMKAELVQKLNKIKGIVPKTTTIPALQSILVKDGYLIANNLEMTVKAKLEGADGDLFLIPQKAFDLINNLPEGEIEIMPKGKDSIAIKAEKIKNTYQTLSPDLFPESEIICEEGLEFTLESEELLKAMRHVAWAISKQNGPIGALCLQAEGGYLNFVALDGHVMAWDKMDYEGVFELLIPKNTVEKILSIGLEGKVSIRYSKTAAVFATDTFEVYTRLVEGNFYPYQNMFEAAPINTGINRSELLDAMIRAKLCTAEKTPSRFEFSGISLDISLKDSTTDYNETLPIEDELSKKLAIGFDARLIIEALKAYESSGVRLGLINANSPMIIESSDSNLKTLVLPVKIRG